jgi:hypothetical protein
MWQGCQAGLSGEACDVGAVVGMTWQEALAYCEALNWGGQIDWRLATAMEIGTLVDDRRRDPALDAAAFPATDLSSSWSATSYGGAASTALMLSLDDGHVFNSTLPEYAKDQNWTLRCVRGAP